MAMVTVFKNIGVSGIVWRGIYSRKAAKPQKLRAQTTPLRVFASSRESIAALRAQNAGWRRLGII